MYSYSWARAVVEEALEKHARVRVAYVEALGLSEEVLAKILAAGRREWPVLRDGLKVLDNWVTRSRFHLTDVGTMREWLIYLQDKSPENLRKYLEKQKIRYTIKEQGTAEGTAGR